MFDQAFRKKGFELPSQTSPTDVLSITTFDEEKDQNRSSGDTCDDKNVKAESAVESEKSKSKKKKRKLTTEISEIDQTDASQHRKKKYIDSKDKDLSVGPSDSEIDEKRVKKRKNRVSLEEVASESDSQKNVKESHKKKKKNKDEEPEVETCNKNETDKTDDNEEAVECENEEESDDKKKKRKRKRRHNNSANEISGPLDKGLQVMGKKEWKKLRNKYLDLQRLRMKQLKQHMRKVKCNQWGEKNKMEFEQDETVTVKKENTSSSLEFTPGVIVKVKLNEVCVDPKGFKVIIKQNNNLNISWEIINMNRNFIAG